MIRMNISMIKKNTKLYHFSQMYAYTEMTSILKVSSGLMVVISSVHVKIQRKEYIGAVKGMFSAFYLIDFAFS